MSSGQVETPASKEEQRRFGASVLGDVDEALLGADVGDVAGSHRAIGFERCSFTRDTASSPPIASAINGGSSS
jgi:hypothetical protein